MLVKAARKKSKTDDDAPKSPQRDSDATATKRGKKGYFGYKGHIGVDQGSGIIRRVRFTTASAHDATKRANLLYRACFTASKGIGAPQRR